MSHRQNSNSWGHAIASPQEVAANQALHASIDSLIENIGDIIGLNQKDKDQGRDIIFTPHRYSSINEYEKQLKTVFKPLSGRDKLDAAINQRTRIIVEEISPYLTGKSLLDIGCGNGLVSHSVSSRFENVLLLDVVNYLSPEIRCPFLAYQEGAPFPIAETFDTVLLLTVLHHAGDPLYLLREAWKATRRRLIIIESVFGADDADLVGHYPLAGKSLQDQMGYAIFVDWFCNRILNDDIPTPYNFTTPSHWLEIFQDERMPIAHTVNLGQDIPGAPELHYLFVLEKPSIESLAAMAAKNSLKREG